MPAQLVAEPISYSEGPGSAPREAPEGFTLLIPAYNEDQGIGPVLDGLCEELETASPSVPFEILVVDDGSKDQTASVVRSKDSKRVRLVSHDFNRGYGASIKTGVRFANFPWIVTTDADGTYPHRAIPELLQHCRNYDMVVGARTGQNTAIPLLRRPAKWVLTRLAAYLSRQPIPDLNSGLRALKKSTFLRYEHILPEGFSLSTTITIALLTSGYRVKYVPIDYFKRTGKSKIRPIADTWNFLVLIVRTILYFEPLRIFLPCALLFILAGMAVGVLSWRLTGRVMDVTTVLLCTTGIQMFALGMVADVLSRRPR
ncbi:MAG TPA: glycosyltransferase family 2 protein [Polyangiaceae bacterium]